MQPDNANLLHQKSDRVRRLTASCVQSVLWLRHGYEMPFADAIDLARIHDVRSAVRIFEEKLELFQSVPQANRFKLAAAEAALTGTLGSREVVDQTVALRRVSIGAMSESEQLGVSREILVARLRELRRRWDRWASEYLRFIERVASLYLQADQDLKLLRLEPETAIRAKTELEHVMLDALRKAGHVACG